ncbi:MOSC domain-containing protein [Kitasatospora sp. NPDC004614]|uniref:MOSC domain-containing protein n=1 Tax=unclassified Kitasatospora TaxID=2633591 RepID=UPI0036C200A1
MWQGTAVSLHLAPTHGAPLVEVREAVAVTGRGLEGDRYFQDHPGDTPPRRASRVCEISLIDIDALTALEREHGIHLTLSEARRNVVCRGVPLTELVGREFTVGDQVRLLGIALSEPCARLEQLTRPGVLRGLLHRGGLRARILEGGTLRTGDPIRPADP